jgi:GNAT superfamily N-acetyltransferase
MASGIEHVAVEPMHPASAPAVLIMRSYLDEVVGRYHGRKLAEAELDAAVREFPNDELAPPAGLLLLARAGDATLGCAGLRFVGEGIGEVTRVFVVRSARGTGLSERLMREIELRARERGVHELRLDTRADLVEAQRLFSRLGYAEASRLTDSPYADRWYRKRLA